MPDYARGARVIGGHQTFSASSSRPRSEPPARLHLRGRKFICIDPTLQARTCDGPIAVTSVRRYNAWSAPLGSTLEPLAISRHESPIRWIATGCVSCEENAVEFVALRGDWERFGGLGNEP